MDDVVFLSRLQFALTAGYHWIFVPLTLGLGIIQAVMETIYVRTGNEKWKRMAKFWMTVFGINFAMGVATGLILEFQFGTNWSNYSWFVGDIFGAPLAIEGILAFFMEATFVAVMFFGWNRVSKGFHLTATWLTAIGASISALWILVANAWMQYPVGMTFNPDTARNEMVDFWAVLFSPVAINKFFHAVTSGFVLAAVFVIGVSAWFLLKKRDTEMALSSIKIAAIFGLFSAVALAFTGDKSGYHVAQKQPMKLAAIEALYDGRTAAPLSAIGLLNTSKECNDNSDTYLVNIPIPYALSYLANRDFNSYVPGINDLLNGGYICRNEEDAEVTALSVSEKMARGKLAIAALSDYQAAKDAGNDTLTQAARQRLDENFAYFGYGYFKAPEDAVPNVSLLYYSFHFMVILGVYFILFFALAWWWHYRKTLARRRWFLYLALWSIPLPYLAGQLGWIVSEVGRQPWAIQDLLPVSAAISHVEAGTVLTTLILFAVLFTVLLIAEIKIMTKEIKKGFEDEKVKG